MIILGSVVNISIAALFIAASSPRSSTVSFVMGITYLFALRLGLATEPWMGLAASSRPAAPPSALGDAVIILAAS